MDELLTMSERELDSWANTFTLAHLRVPRVEFIAWDSMDEAYNVVAALVVDKALTAFSATTWPGHEPGGPT